MRATISSRKIFCVCLTLAAVGTAVRAQESQSSFETSCKSLIGLAVPSAAATSGAALSGTVGNAQWVAAGREGMSPVPEHCKVTGKLNQRTGIDGKAYAIGFELRLPKDWNQRFYFQGGGGTDGVLRPAMGAIPSGAVAPNALSNGFAVVATDAGHLNEPGPQGGYLFGADPQARADYGYNHLPVVSAAAKALIQRIYGSAPKRSYFVGCSNGGRQGMMATQRYPELFDGVIAAAPAYRVVEASLDAAVQTQIFASIAPAGPDGRPLLGGAFTPAELGVLAKGILNSCDALDGATDGMVNNVRECKFDPTAVQCSTGDSSACLPINKVAAIKRAFGGARKKNGELVYSQWPYDPGIATPLWTMWKTGSSSASPPQALNTTLVAGALSHVFTTPPQLTADLYGFALSVDPDTTLAQTQQRAAPFTESGKSVVNADSPNIDAFTKHGGKIIFYHGMADGIFSPHDTVQYLQALQKRYGKKADEFSRLYLIPGMGHCSGGPATDQFDAVSALVEWVENKKAPGTLIAKTGANSAWPDRSRPLCAYPKQATYSGKGDIEDAGSFECK